jgi:hypothetical protein
MFKNRYAAPGGHQYDGIGEWPTVRDAMQAAVQAVELALPGTRWLGTRPWGPDRELAHVA